MKKISGFISCCFILMHSFCQRKIELLTPAGDIKPLTEISFRIKEGAVAKVFDAKGTEYFSSPVKNLITFVAGGAAGKQLVCIYDKNKEIVDSISFNLVVSTDIDDGGIYKKLFDVLHKGMLVYSEDGTESPIKWRGQSRHFLVPWILDNYHTMKGMQYFNDYGKNLVDVMKQMQRKDGMIWSFIASNEAEYYFETAYKKYGFFLRDTDAYFVRQPVENHVEYNYVCSIYKCWKASGDDVWMKELLASASASLDYCVNDSLRWSSKYKLLKRALTIDSWDFQVADEYTPQLGPGTPMLVVYNKTKFGVFYGDNTGYIQACNELALMYDYAGNKKQADRYRQRAREIESRLNDLAWNGSFYTHFIEEDTTVKRKLGVDMPSQLSQSNAYSINRGIDHDKSVAIIKSYLNLKAHLPQGSPGEWYSVYPPFQTGFEPHNAIWQYMNGGVGGHIAGELALGAFENGYEAYGVDIMKRVLDLGIKYGAGKRIWFAYTGSYPDPPAVNYKPVDLNRYVNRDFTTDFPNMPTGKQLYNGVVYTIPDHQNTNHLSGIALSSLKGYAKRVEIPVNDSAKTIYLLHTGMGTVSDNIYASVTFRYTDSTEKSVYLIKEKNLTNWWFPSLKNDYTGVAWHGPNANSTSVGTYYTAIGNPDSRKKIEKIIFQPVLNEAVYIIFGITLADQVHYIKPKPESFGGPDNWAAATCMQALVKGLAGVQDNGTAFSRPAISPRWIFSGTDAVTTTIRYAASGGYVSYHFVNNKNKKTIEIIATGNGDKISFHVQLPSAATAIRYGEKPIEFKNSVIENSFYADFETVGSQVKKIRIEY
jgi:hypothetical protein